MIRLNSPSPTTETPTSQTTPNNPRGEEAGKGDSVESRLYMCLTYKQASLPTYLSRFLLWFGQALLGYSVLPSWVTALGTRGTTIAWVKVSLSLSLLHPKQLLENDLRLTGADLKASLLLSAISLDPQKT